MERSLMSNRGFQLVSADCGNLDNKEQAVLDELFNHFRSIFPRPDGVIYLHTNCQTCLKRIEKRGRPEENGIDIEYLRKIENKFLDLGCNCSVMKISGDYDLKKPQKTIESIMDFIQNC